MSKARQKEIMFIPLLLFFIRCATIIEFRRLSLASDLPINYGIDNEAKAQKN